jgi:hypothetical protein
VSRMAVRGLDGVHEAESGRPARPRLTGNRLSAGALGLGGPGGLEDPRGELGAEQTTHLPEG